MAWSAEKVELLLKLNEQELSASQIARRLGEGVTRNAVIGKLNRMGLSCGGGKPKALAPRRHPQERPAKRSSGKSGGAVLKLLAPQPAKRDVHIHDLSDMTCRFPMGDPREKDFRFCGAPKELNDLPYCEYHTQLAHQRSHQHEAKAEEPAMAMRAKRQASK